MFVGISVVIQLEVNISNRILNIKYLVSFKMLRMFNFHLRLLSVLRRTTVLKEIFQF